MTMTNSTVRDGLINPTWDIFADNSTLAMFSPLINTAFHNNNSYGAAGSPKVGAMFAPLALSIPNATIMMPASASSILGTSRGSKSNKAIIAGAIVGSIVGVVLIIFTLIYILRKIGEPHGVEQAEISKIHPYEIQSTTSDATDAAAIRLTEKSRREAQHQRTQVLSDAAIAGASTHGPGADPAAESGNLGDLSLGASGGYVRGLRQEVEDLRQVIHRLEPPPTYQST
ncbi:hypothetical protein PsYK624_114000 [Phanerochaete sordida]|uniref:Uncharacterized protein n=1 Tax=Phanerochaete sordida TaxID=48140 RepID=A0A9P3GJ61_9APHY|nr:hypothetical protein PsYK624_114000 [Phanerochaete sordida]